MQLMSKLIGGESKPGSSILLSGSQRLTPRRGSANSSSLMASSSWMMPTMTQGNVTKENSLVKVLHNNKVEFAIPKIMQPMAASS